MQNLEIYHEVSIFPRGWVTTNRVVAFAAAMALLVQLGPAAGSASAQDVAAFSVDQPVVVNTDALNLRADSLLASDLVTTLQDGAWATVLDGPVSSDDYAWYQLDFDGTTGWAAGEFLAGAASDTGLLPAGSTVVVNTDALNLRGSAGLDGEIPGTLATGDEGIILSGPESIEGTDWYEIDVDGTTGWVAGAFLRV